MANVEGLQTPYDQLDATVVGYTGVQKLTGDEQDALFQLRAQKCWAALVARVEALEALVENGNGNGTD